jgi:copper chaperone CopZ
MAGVAGLLLSTAHSANETPLDNCSKSYRVGSDAPQAAEEAAGTSQTRDAATRLSERGPATNGFPTFACAHHVPGRLRLRSAALKHNRDALAAACRELFTLPGVTSVSPSLLTGSIVVKYDPLVSSPESVLQEIRWLGFSPAEPISADSDCPAVALSAEHFTGATGRKLLELAIERLAVALVAKVI